jgi:hypothetical protein
MKEIKLTKGKVTLVDDEDFKELNKYNWYYSSGYARRNITTQRGQRVTQLLHRILIQHVEGFEIDHKNQNKLDNRKENLRIVTGQQNRFNRNKNKNNTSGFKGVHKTRWGWRACIRINKEDKYLGLFSSSEEAARAYDNAAKELCGEYACLNF